VALAARRRKQENPMIATAQKFTLTDLLTTAGARVRGRGRADCPRCKRQRSVSFDESRGVYYCHGAGCDFSGGAAKLANEQGLTTGLTANEYSEVCQNRHRADRAARLLYGRVKARRSELLALLHSLNEMEAAAHMFGPDDPAAWDTFGTVYGERPAVLAELAILEHCRAADLIRFLSERRDTRKRLIEGVLLRGGLWDSQGKFVEVSP